MSDTTETTETAETGTTPETPKPEAETASAWEDLFKGEDPEKVRKALTHAREWEKRAKDNAEKAKRLDEFEESQKSELQKAADAATKAQTEAETAKAELARMQAAVKHGLSADDLELLGSHGTPEEIDARAEKLATRLKAAADSKPKPDFGGGDRGGDVGSKAGQLTREDMKRMSPEEIVEASEKGQFDDLLKPT